MYIFQEMVDTETEYVKSLQYIMDVSAIFSILVFLSFFFFLVVCFFSHHNFFLFLFLFFFLLAELPGRDGQPQVTTIAQRQEEYSLRDYRKNPRFSQTVRVATAVRCWVISRRNEISATVQ